MHRPLRDPFYLRVWRLIRGLLFYNTVYWRRASDGLNMPTLSPEERERQRPERNLEIIRPRVRPRAHIEAAKGGEISNPPSLTAAEILAQAYAAEHAATSEEHDAAEGGQADVDDDGAEQIYVKRRRYRRRNVTRGSLGDRDSFFARVFGRK